MAWCVIGDHRNNFIILMTETLNVFFLNKPLILTVQDFRIKGGIQVTGRRGRRRRKLLDYLTEGRGYLHLKEEALDRTMWRARFGRGFGPVVRQTTK
jgi:hypothetical protein